MSAPNPPPPPPPHSDAPRAGFVVVAAPTGVHVDLDAAAAAPAEAVGLPTVDARAWGPRLRYCADRRTVEAFWDDVGGGDEREGGRLAPYVLSGSGDFHHLSALWQRRVEGEYHLVCFDNHPDWDARPPRWACGGWMGRALENPRLRSASVWGCGNFELAFPSRLFRVRDPRLTVRPWAARLSASARRRYDGLTLDAWREPFERFAESLAGRRVYVTIDLDCLRRGAAYSNWEHGLFETEDVRWAIARLRARADVIGGDLCGAWSSPAYAGWFQRLAARWDHPKVAIADPAEARRVNTEATIAIWRALVGGDTINSAPPAPPPPR